MLQREASLELIRNKGEKPQEAVPPCHCDWLIICTLIHWCFANHAHNSKSTWMPQTGWDNYRGNGSPIRTSSLSVQSESEFSLPQKVCSYVFGLSLSTGAVHIHSWCHPGGVLVWGDGHPCERVRPGLQRDAAGGFSEQLFTASRGVPGLCFSPSLILFSNFPRRDDREISLVQNPTWLYI